MIEIEKNKYICVIGIRKVEIYEEYLGKYILIVSYDKSSITIDYSYGENGLSKLEIKKNILIDKINDYIVENKLNFNSEVMK